jgi:PKD repeat protein
VSSYLWDFGNGSTSSLGSPSTSYNTPGIFYITANVTDANQCTKTIFDTIRIIADGVVDVSANDQIRVYPNPFTDEISLEFSDFGTREDVKIQLLNVTNQVVYAVEKENIDLTKSTMQIPSSAFSPGTYIIKIKINDELYTTKLIKRQ